MIMKKVINSLFVIIAAMVTFAGCAKQEIDAPATSETKTVQFFANSIETKTEFGTPTDGVYPTLWSAEDKVKILVNLDQLKDTEKTVAVECSDDFKSARFKAELADPQTESYTFYSISPSTKLIGKPAGKLYVEIKDAQTPLATSVDKEAQLLFAKSKTTEKMPTSVDLNYQHLTAYGKFSLANLADESVLSIKIEAPEDVYLAGKWDYVIADDNLVVRTGNGLNTITLTTSSTTDIWFACAPVDMTGQKMTLTVTTEKGNFVKVLNFPADKERKFEAGKISKFTVDMAGIEVEEPEQPGETTEAWTLVTDASTLAVGDKIVIVASDSNYAMGADKGNNRNAASITKSGNTVVINDDVQIITLEAGKVSTTFAFNTGAGYLYAASSTSNHLKTKTTLDNNGSWAITITPDGVATIKAQGTYTKNWIRKNSNSELFSCYGSGQEDVSIYRLEGANEGGGETPEPKVLESIAVSGATTNYVVGNEFKKPTVTATYNDATTADVTASATFSGYNMAVAGTYTVTVSYTEGEKTATATYQITVVESQNLPEGIASIKSKATSTNDTEFAVVLTDAVVTYVSGSNAYIEDAEAGILIYKSGHGLAAGDKLNGVVSGTVKLYKNLREITSIDYSEATRTTGADVPVTVLTLAQLNADGAYDKYENMRVKVIDATVSETRQISQGDQTYALYFKGQSLTGFDLYNIIDVIGYPSKFDDAIQFNVWENAVVKGATKTTITGISDVTVKVNETTVINAVASSGAKVTYVSGNSAIATVDEDGTVTGVAEGETTITVSVPAYNGYPAAEQTCKVTVTAAEQGGGEEPEQPGEPVTITKSISSYGFSNEQKVTSIKLDDIITATASTGTNNGKYYTSDKTWRFYQNDKGTLTISAKDNYLIQSVKLTFTTKDNGVLKYLNATISTNVVCTVEAQTASFTVGSTSGTKGKVFVKEIEVVYKKN